MWNNDGWHNDGWQSNELDNGNNGSISGVVSGGNIAAFVVGALIAAMVGAAVVLGRVRCIDSFYAARLEVHSML